MCYVLERQMRSENQNHRRWTNFGLNRTGKLLLVQCLAVPVCLTPAYAQDAVVLDPISITAAEVAPGGVQITEEELEKTNPSNIKDVFANETSVNIGGGSDVSRKIYVNGIENTNINVKIDEARQVDSAFHHLGTAIIDPGLLKSVRIETGVGPVDVGPNALGGSIAFETKDARDIVDVDETFGGFATYRFNSNGPSHNESSAIAAQHDGFELLVYGSNDHGNSYHDARKDEAAGTAPAMENLLGKFAWTSLHGGRIEAHANYLNDKSIRPNRANFGQLVNGAPATPHEFRRRNFSVSYRDEAPTDMINPEIVLSYNESRLDIQGLAFGPNSFNLSSETTSYSGKLANTFSTGLGIAKSGGVTVGTDFYRDVGHGTPSGGFGGAGVSLDSTETSDNVGLFVQTRLNLTDATRLSFGVRYDQQQFEGLDGTDIDGGGPSASTNIEHDIVNGLTGYAGAASTYGGVPLGESAIYNFAGQWVYNDLSSSRSQNYKAGFKGEAGGFSGDIHYYYTEILGSHDRGNLIRNSTRDITSRGFNISGQYNAEDWYLGTAFSDNTFRSDGVRLASGNASFHGLDLGRKANLNGGIHLLDHTATTGFSIERTFGGDTNLGTQQQPYTVVNIFGQYEPEALSGLMLRLDVKNLFDELYVDQATSGFDNAQVIPFNEPGRSILATAKISF